MEPFEKGYLQVYTGEGKGKTTAALGLALRAAGAGLRVLIVQFIKMGDYSEINALGKLSDHIQVEQYGCGRFIDGRPSKTDVAAAQQGVKRVQDAMKDRLCDVLILEEANVAVKKGVIDERQLLEIIAARPDDMEMIVTGRYATDRVIAAADLVTEMRMIKHYFQKGVVARVGIEK